MKPILIFCRTYHTFDNGIILCYKRWRGVTYFTKSITVSSKEPLLEPIKYYEPKCPNEPAIDRFSIFRKKIKPSRKKKAKKRRKASSSPSS